MWKLLISSIALLGTFFIYGHAYDLNTDLARGLSGNLTENTRSRIIDVLSFSNYPEDCSEIYSRRNKSSQSGISSGVYEIWPRRGKPFKVWCDMETDGGGWTVFQRRADIIPREDFYRTWLEYKRGFGNLEGEFWLGNDRLWLLTNQDSYRLRFDLEDFDNEKRFAEYETIQIADENDKYRLSVGSFRKGNVADSFNDHNNYRFSTKDQDNDVWSGSCAQVHNGAWWYYYCHSSNLNGGYLRGSHPTINAAGVNWNAWKGHYYSLKTTEMKIRPNWFKP